MSERDHDESGERSPVPRRLTPTEDTAPMLIEGPDGRGDVPWTAFDDASELDIEPAEVLVVDDERRNLEAVEVALHGLDAKLIGVTSGQQALRELLRRNVALILLDVHLPTLDGFETARLIRSRTRNRHVPIVFLTAHNQNEEDMRRGYKLGAVDYLFKPFAPDVLRAKVQAFVDLRNRTAQVRAQAKRLHELERQASERRLREARREWEAAALRRKMEEQREINAHLEQADRRKDEFLAVLAHELRNPLAPLVSGLELIRMDAAGNASIEHACAIMSRQVHHLTRLVDDLLDVSRITRGKVDLSKRVLDVRACIEQSVETCKPLIEAARHTLKIELPGEPLVCDADPVRITQLVSNLLSNAARYTEPGGHLEVCGRVQDDEVVITVRDDGKGIEPHMLERIFDMFVQERTGGEGLGLGLTLVQQLVRMHGGHVAARSEGLGRGAEFEVRLPRVDERALEAPDEACGLPEPPEAPLDVLLVDDHLDIAETTQALLESWGHRVHVAHTGEGGAELAATLRPDLALLDIGLPDIDGYEVATRIRQQLGKQRPYLVAVTGFGQASDRERAYQAGFDGHLVKPATPDCLRGVLREVQRSGTVNLSPA